ncbi:MAG: 50S ribosomal protein L37ae [Candidatus Micrarchaeota archaeon]
MGMGSHYGVKIRKREDAVLKMQHARYACPVCAKEAVRRDGYARWGCRSCGAIIAGGAYQLETGIGAAARKALSSAKPL